MPEQPCPFCNFDPEKNRLLWETKNHIVVLSNPRLMPGHTLVIPKQHVGAIFELDSAVAGEILGTVLRFQKKMIRIFSERWGKPAGCDVSWHTRPFMPQTALAIPGHAHIHLRPRFWEDPYFHTVLTHETGFFQQMDPAERQEYQILLAE